MKAAAIYARVSSEQQKEENTIASQTAALIDFAREQGYSVPDDWVIEDAGFSGIDLVTCRCLAGLAKVAVAIGRTTQN